MKKLAQFEFTSVLLISGAIFLTGTQHGFAAGDRPVQLATGLARPVFMTTPPADNNRLFILEQHTGIIKIYDKTTQSVLGTPFLTVSGVTTGNEQGLLGMAFHPDYANNGFFYVDYTDGSGNTQIKRYTVSGNPNVANSASVQAVLTINQPQSNHNGGWIGFGPDGFLYVASGDGGGGDDNDSGHDGTVGNGQDITSCHLGKMLRIDVNGDDFTGDATKNYANPPSNPFVGVTGDDEIWAYGLRNPWRCSFDKLHGDLWIGDVGQNVREEIDFQNVSSTGGENYGWRLREGTVATPSGGVGGAAPPGAIEPVYDYLHGSGTTQGFAVTGGYVYRGSNTLLQGKYFFGDYATERIWSLEVNRSTGLMVPGSFIDWTTSFVPNIGTIDEVASFGEDPEGNLYVCDLGGQLFRIEFGDQTIDASDTGGNGMNNGNGDDFVLTRNGAAVDVSIDGNFSQSFTLANINSLIVAGSGDDDTLTIDFTNGNPIPAGGVVFNGAGQGVGGDSLALSGTASFANGMYTFANASDGTIDLDGSVITYTGLEPISDLLMVASRSFLLNDSGNTVGLSDEGGGLVRLSSDSAETVVFSAPTAQLILQTGDGDDSITAGNLGFAGAISVIISSGDGDDEFTIAPGVNYPVSANGGSQTSGDNFIFDGVGSFSSGDFSSGIISQSGFTDVSVSDFESGSLTTADVKGWNLYE